MTTKKIQSFFFVLFIGLFSNLFSQQFNYTLNRDFLWGLDKHYNQKEENIQTFVKPYRYQQIKDVKDSSATFPRLLSGTKAETFDKKLDKQLEFYPLIHTQIGYDAYSSNPTNNLAIGGNLLFFWKNKFALNIKALGGQGIYNSFNDSIIDEINLIPGIGKAYLNNNDSANKRYAYEYYSGYISYSPNKIFNFQLGKDKHFWGDGYRSLFLSDVAAPYPYFKITTNIWKLTYVNLFTAMKDMTHPSGLKKDWTSKYATFHYLGCNLTKRINIGIFESIIWQGSDSSRQRSYDINYLNPIIFYRPTEYSLGSSDNAFMGLSFKIKLFQKQQLYGQLLLDEFLLKAVKADIKHSLKNDSTQWGWWANKQAFQIGLKSFDLFHIKNLNFQTEWNLVRPYTYAHGSVQQNYGHMNQSLAHPLGANFKEAIVFLNYRYKRFFIEFKYTNASYGRDSSGINYGKNIFISYTNRPNDYGNYTTQGVKENFITTSLRCAYMLDTRMNLKVELGIANRTQKTAYTTKQIPYVFLGIKTDLSNMYDDF